MQRLLLALAFVATATVVTAQSADRAAAYDGARVLMQPNPPAPSQARGGVLFDQTDLVTSVGTGPAGADESALQTALTMTTFGAGHSTAAGVFVADDFTVPAGETWNVDGFNFYAYQTGGTTSCTMTAYVIQIWDGPPGNGGTVIAGDRTTNLFQGCDFANIYRVRDVDPPGAATTRPIYASMVAFAAPLALTEGTYWVEWSASGSLASGPWVPPVTVVGQTTTGNARQEISGTWNALQDGGSLTPQGLPFQVLGTTGGGGGDVVTFPSTDTPVSITDNAPSGVTSTIVIPGSETRNIADLDVDLNATHSWIGDLFISLARGATSVTIMDRPGYTGTGFGCSGDNPNIIADDEGTDGAIETGCVSAANPGYPVPDGRYTPDQPLSAFDGTAMAGTYVLTVSDNAAGDTGSLDSWALVVTPEGGGPSPLSMIIVREQTVPVPASGGEARMAFRFTNLTPAPVATTTWAELEVPGGGLITIPGSNVARLLVPKELSLTAAGTPGDTRRWGIRFIVLASAPAGEYTYRRFAGTQGGEILASEEMTWTKAAASAVETTPGLFEAPDADDAVVMIGEGGMLTLVQPEAMSALETHGGTSMRVSPNPVSTQGQVSLSVATSQAVRVALYDALGREVRVLLDRTLTAGQEAHIGFRTSDLPAGVYVIRAVGADVSLTERVTVVR